MIVVTMMNLVDGMYIIYVTYAIRVWGHPYSDVNEVNRIWGYRQQRSTHVSVVFGTHSQLSE